MTLTIQSEPRLETRKPTKRAKWRSSMSAYRSVAQKLVDTADIVRDRDFATVDSPSTSVIARPGVTLKSALGSFQLGLSVGEIISFLLAPAEDSCLRLQSALLRFCLVHSLPFRDRVLFGSIGPAASHHSILQDSRLVSK